MRYVVTGIVLAGLAGCSWFGGDKEASRDGDRTKVGYSSYELSSKDAGAPRGAIDPVSGEWVARDTSHRATYDDLTYFFASKDNMKSFERRPHEFVTADGYLRKPLDEVRREAEVK